MFPISDIVRRLGDSRIGSIGDIDAGKALVYLVRRFGFPQAGSDERKEVCDYYIDTDLPGVQVCISVGGQTAYIRLAISDEIQTRCRVEEIDGTDGQLSRQVRDAVEASIRNLLCPVWVRDVPITLLGEARDDELGEYWEGLGKYENEVPYSATAGWGVPRECFRDPELFYRFVEWVMRRGGGDFVIGMMMVMPAESGESGET